VKRPLFYGWILVGGFWITYGVLFGFPVFAPPVINAYIVRDLHLTRETLAKIMGAFTLASGLLAPLASFLTRRYGSRVCLMTYCATMLAACLGLALLAHTGGELMLLYILLSASTTGSMVATQSALTRWFVRRRAAAIAATLTGMAVLGSAITLLLPRLIAAGGWRAGWWLGAALAAIAGLVVVLVVRDAPEEAGLHADGAERSLSPLRNRATMAVHQTTQTWTPRLAVRTTAIWLIVVLGSVSSVAQTIFFTHAVVHLRDLGFPAATAGLVISASALSTLLGKIFIGLVGDHIEPRLLAGLAYALLGVGLILLLHPTSLLTILSIGTLAGLSIGMQVACEPLLIGNYYGTAVFPFLSAMRAFFTSPTAAILSTLAGRWFDLTGSYRMAFGGTGTICLLAASVFVLFLRPPHTAQAARVITAADDVTTSPH
jgi:MFS family permease